MFGVSLISQSPITSNEDKFSRHQTKTNQNGLANYKHQNLTQLAYYMEIQSSWYVTGNLQNNSDMGMSKKEKKIYKLIYIILRVILKVVLEFIISKWEREIVV